MKAKIIIGEKYCSLGVNVIKSPACKLPMYYDGNSLKNVIEILQKFNYGIELISYYDFIESNYSSNDIFIVTQWILNRFTDKKAFPEIKNKVNELVKSGNHFILMHHFWPQSIFADVLDIKYFEGISKGWFQNKFQLNILNEHLTLRNIDTFLKYNAKNLGSDEFTFQYKVDGKFVTLIQKIPKTKNPKNFISFGYQKNNNSYIFLIDVHNIGKTESHSFYFDILLNNTMFFLDSKD